MELTPENPSLHPLRDEARRPAPSAGPIRMLALDLDGTLLTSSKKIGQKTAAALHELAERDVKVVIASARPPRSVRHVYQLLGLNTWQINYNGALIWDEPALLPVFHCPMAGDLVMRMIDMARDMFDEVLVSCEILDRWHTDRLDETFTTETGRLFKPDVIAACETFCNQPITKLMLLGDPRMLARIEPILLEKFGQSVTLVQTDRDLLQIMDRRVSKAVALQRVAEHYGVSSDQIMAIGDAPNDVGMLQFAGIAVAVENAHPLLKQVAHWIAPSNDDHGVHMAMLRYGLCR